MQESVNETDFKKDKSWADLADEIKVRFSAIVEDKAKKNINSFPENIISMASVVLDVVLFIDLEKRVGMRGLKEWWSFYFEAPQAYPNLLPERDSFKQLANLQNALYYLK